MFQKVGKNMATSTVSLSKERNKEKYAERMAFSKFVSSKKDVTEDVLIWRCCGDSFKELRDIHIHVAKRHSSDVEHLRKSILENGDEDARWSVIRGLKRKSNSPQRYKEISEDLPVQFVATDTFSWLPAALKDNVTDENKSGKVLLFYRYRDIKNEEHVKSWQEELCRRLQLTGKIRVASEGLNATVGGSTSAIEIYKTAVMSHPLFGDMTPEDFKESEGGAKSFGEGLKVGIYKEAVPMGVDPSEVSFLHAGKHVNPEEFHQAVENHLKNQDSKSVFIDCRNFYESKIGSFKGAVAPDIRKFSYWPEYVEKNKEFLKDKSVYMYCTGGIRCERGSAYLRQKNICQDVYQLKGGIHKYLEKYPDGYFRGKLFVFDDRYAIKANEDVISCCVYCGSPWDEYAPCSSGHCHQLVLSCSECRSKHLTACCKSCKNTDSQEAGQSREECECTRRRNRIPTENNDHAMSSRVEGNTYSSSNNDKHNQANTSSSNQK